MSVPTPYLHVPTTARRSSLLYFTTSPTKNNNLEPPLAHSHIAKQMPSWIPLHQRRSVKCRHRKEAKLGKKKKEPLCRCCRVEARDGCSSKLELTHIRYLLSSCILLKSLQTESGQDVVAAPMPNSLMPYIHSIMLLPYDRCGRVPAGLCLAVRFR